MRTDSLYNEFQKIKFDPEYVQAFMGKQRKLPPVFEGMKLVELGNSNATNELILVLSPSCASCRQSYWSAKKMIDTNDTIHCKIIFAASLAENDVAGIVSKTILSQTDELDMAVSLENWFTDDSKNIKK